MIVRIFILNEHEKKLKFYSLVKSFNQSQAHFGSINKEYIWLEGNFL